MTCFYYRFAAAGAILLGALASHADAATTTPILTVNFDGSLSGGVYTPGPGELAPASFAGSGSVTVSGGVADVPGDADITSGFLFNGSPLALGGVNLQTTSWVSEVLFNSDAPASGQPLSPSNPTGGYANHLLDVRGDTFYRYDGYARNPKSTTIGYWDGGAEVVEDVGEPAVGVFQHVALVWDAPTNTLEAYLNGVSQNTASTGNAFDVPSANVGYGFFARFSDRAVDGQLDGVAFATFTGDFDASADFQLGVVPEPTVIALAGIAAFVGLSRRRIFG